MNAVSATLPKFRLSCLAEALDSARTLDHVELNMESARLHPKASGP